ncbi:MAG: hypothetical protein K2H43_03395, partial [Clostridia bacterium]|nr:hypothetical protein [Clostridia bacterium]
DTYREAYFFGLTKNFGDNTHGSCGYIALSQILSYYDSFLDDNIIDEKYDVESESASTNFLLERNSPGTLDDTITEEDLKSIGVSIEDSVEKTRKKLSATNYYRIIEKKKDISLHAKLISIGYDLGFYNQAGRDSVCSSNSDEWRQIVNVYLTSRGYKTGFDYNFGKVSSSTSQEGIVKFTKDMIDRDLPVILTFQEQERELPHAAVAYDYDDNYIYVNMGYHLSGYTRYGISIKYDQIRGADILEFSPNVQHSHSNNYRYNNPETNESKTYCTCSCAIITYKQLHHDFNVGYQSIPLNPANPIYSDLTNHKALCECGNFILEKHVWKSVQGGVTANKYKVCEKCKVITNDIVIPKPPITWQ